MLSTGTEKEDRTEKLPIYAQAGVSHAWLLDPHTKAGGAAGTLEAYELEGGQRRELGQWHGGERVRVSPFEAMGLELAGAVSWLTRLP